MSPQEWWWVYDIKRPRDATCDYAGSLTQSTVDELSEMLLKG